MLARDQSHSFSALRTGVPRFAPYHYGPFQSALQERYWGHTMKRSLAIVTVLCITSLSASAQEPTRQDPLLDRLARRWILRGTIAGHETTHDVESEWVLGDEYLQLRETSRDKNA
jgi:hypothetical protein